jgi:hypothetical protein
MIGLDVYVIGVLIMYGVGVLMGRWLGKTEEKKAVKKAKAPSGYSEYDTETKKEATK